jgi:hypothetical protein
MMEGLIVLGGFLSFILILLFFELVSHVRHIRQGMFSKNPEYWQKQYNKSLYLGRQDQALFALQEFIWYSMEKKKDKKTYDSLKEKYQPEFKRLGGEFPLFMY